MSKKSILKRVKITGNNLILVKKSGKRHLLSHKTSKSKRFKKKFVQFHYRYAQKLL